MPAPNEISQKQLTRLLGTPSAPTIVDVCIDTDFQEDPRVIPTAIRARHDDISNLVQHLNGRNAVIVCQKGKKLSQGVAAILRNMGVKAEYLMGGNIAWRDAGLPLIPIDKIPYTSDGKKTRWVTRHRPKIDRIACPWLIRRFVDPKAEFLFVAPAEVAAVAEKFDATPFDIEGGHWSHHDGLCSFDMMIKEFALDIPALSHLANVVRAADTNRHDLAPEAAGLLAFSVGLSRQFKDDNAQLDAGIPLYDALYRWARDGKDEPHDWPQSTSRKLSQ